MTELEELRERIKRALEREGFDDLLPHVYEDKVVVQLATHTYINEDPQVITRSDLYRIIDAVSSVVGGIEDWQLVFHTLYDDNFNPNGANLDLVLLRRRRG